MIKKILTFTNVLLYLVLVALWISIPEELTLNLSLTLFNLALTSALMISAREKLKVYYLSSQFQKFSSAFISVFLIFCILALLNYLAFKHPYQIDFSKDKESTLKQQTIQVVQSLKAPLKILVFANRGQFSAFRGLLELYQVQKNAIEVQYVDVALEPALVSKYKIQQPNTLVFEYMDKQQVAEPYQFAGPPRRLLPPGELQITNALVKLSREGKIRLYYTQGHGESSWDSAEGSGFTSLKRVLEAAAFEIIPLNLLEAPRIPEDANILIVWGPKDGFLKRELKAIDSYLKKGGNLAIALDTNLNVDQVVDVRELLLKWGINLRNNLVIDQVRHVQGSSGSVPLVDQLNTKHIISKNIGSPVFFPLVGSLSVANNTINKGELQFLAQSTSFPGSWAETSPKEFVGGKVTFNEGEDFKGPIGLAGVWKSENGKTKILAIGNSTLVSNTYAKFSGNFSLLLNSFSWMADESRLISFESASLTDNPVFISRPQLGIIFYFSVVFVPLVLLGSSFFLYRRRSTL